MKLMGRSFQSDSSESGVTSTNRRHRTARGGSGFSLILAGVGGVGPCRKGLCGQEAACKPFSNNTYVCVCPHDSSPPTADLKCPNRITVPITPHPIHNIIPPSRINVSVHQTYSNTSATHESLPAVTERASIDRNILLSSSACAILILVVLVAICWRKRTKLRSCLGEDAKPHKTSCTPSPMVLKKSVLVADRYTVNPQYSACSSLEVPLLQSETLRFMQEIGQGCFGKVFKGELSRDRSGTETVEVVAIKVLKECASREAEEDFMREVDIMSAFRHQNILSLVGVVLKEPGMTPMMVFEYMSHGDLAEVLRENAHAPPPTHYGHSNDSSGGSSEEPPRPLLRLDSVGLMSIALQISAGMRYLAAQRFVHRDLACRNCLVTDGPVVKIADFGMSRDVYTCDYYKIGGSRLLPVRWMSPESVMYGRFTLESDIWSYGIVLWEIYSLGKQPYYGHTNEEVVKLILQGIMLIPPDDCPSVIFDLMRSCWKTEARDRIKFPDIHEKLQKAYDNLKNAQVSDRSGSIRKKTLPKNVNLPRPPPVDDLLDIDGYLMPQESNSNSYLEALPD